MVRGVRARSAILIISPQILRVSLYHSLVSLHTQELQISFVLLTLSSNVTKYLTRFALERRYRDCAMEGNPTCEFIYANKIGQDQY